MSDLSNYVAQRVFDHFGWFRDEEKHAQLSAAIEAAIFSFNVANCEALDRAGVRRGDSMAKAGSAKPKKAAKMVYDDTWWRDVIERLRTAVAVRDKAAGVDLAATNERNKDILERWEAEKARLRDVERTARDARREAKYNGAAEDYIAYLDEEVNKTAEARNRFMNTPVQYEGYGSKPHAAPIWVFRPAFTCLYKGEILKASAVKQMKVPALCYWPGGVLPPGFTLLTCTGPITPRGSFDYFTDPDGYARDVALHATCSAARDMKAEIRGNRR